MNDPLTLLFLVAFVVGLVLALTGRMASAVIVTLCMVLFVFLRVGGLF